MAREKLNIEELRSITGGFKTEEFLDYGQPRPLYGVEPDPIYPIRPHYGIEPIEPIK